jgi:dTDP-4-dehydrorhamnose reductase
LDKSKLAANGFMPLPTWQDALSRYLKEIEE